MVDNCPTLRSLLKELTTIRGLQFSLENEQTKIYLKKLLDDPYKYTVGEVAESTTDDIERTLRVLRRLKSTVNLDQLGSKTYIERRRRQLKELDYALYLSELYGMRAAKDLLQQSAGLKVKHKWSTQYLRDHSGDATELFQALAEEKTKDGYQEFFVNSPTIQDKLSRLSVFSGRQPSDRDFQVEELAEGLYRVTVSETFLGQNQGIDRALRQGLKVFGATPSSFLGVKQRYFKEESEAFPVDVVAPAPPKRQGRGGAKGSNRVRLQKIVKGLAFSEVKKLAGPKSNLASVYGCISRLIGGLQALAAARSRPGVQKEREFDTSRSVESALQSIANLLEALAAASAHSLHVMRIYELLIDELFLILATLAPYDEKALRRIVKKVYHKRIPELENLKSSSVNLRSYLESSGMGAISTALLAACGKNRQVTFVDSEVDYFEVFRLLVKLCDLEAISDNEKKKASVLYSTLNPSDPRKRYEVADIVASVKSRLRGEEKRTLTLVVDITLEKEERELSPLFRECGDELKSGRLEILLVKSFQKYAALGSGKIMSGLVMAVNKKKGNQGVNEKLRGLSNSERFIRLDEVQLLAFFLEHTADVEVDLVKRAGERAQRLARQWRECSVLSSLEGLPFLLFSFPKDKKKAARDVESLLGEVGMESRDTFGYMKTTYLSFSDKGEWYWRIAVGQEPPKRLEEMLYAVRKLPDLLGEMGKGSFKLERWLERELGMAGSDARLAAILHLAWLLCKRRLLPERDEKEAKAVVGRLLEAYEVFFGPGGDGLRGVTPEMRGTLVAEWIDLAFSGVAVKNSARERMLAKIRQYGDYAPAYVLARQYSTLEDKWFAGRKYGEQLTKEFLRRLGTEALLVLFREHLLEERLEAENRTKGLLKILAARSKLTPGLLAVGAQASVSYDLRSEISGLEKGMKKLRRKRLLGGRRGKCFDERARPVKDTILAWLKRIRSLKMLVLNVESHVFGGE